jgi:RimJ/RimL family protein N-acetyltransferase
VSPFHIRPTAATDVASVVLLREDVAGEDRWIMEASPAQREQVTRRIMAGLDDATVGSFVAESEGRVVGSIGIIDGSGVASLGMFVHRDHRGRGIGKALLQAAIEWAGQRGCHKVALEVWPHNAVARSLYLSMGFTEEGHRRRHHRRRDGSLWDAIEMGLILDHTSPGCRYDTP